ncbi:hypothetical protein NUH86_04140 [Sphingobium sp. JS3065]|uniref:hypothetical protein n=1 Tax=Sphingobium sp. JS3065 TaxID=2970925 RepID=UPI002264ACF6|nr:hypothetical protein [Sphingobium sp. JS3065]UZW55990.1 hypothetical protein NUH86_04140 [Sphingobium sp. JS3065]
MIDLSPQPQDKGGVAKVPPSVARPDPVHPERGKKGNGRVRWNFPHDEAEVAIQRISRWAGPVALLLALCLLGWWIIR